MQVAELLESEEVKRLLPRDGRLNKSYISVYFGLAPSDHRLAGKTIELHREIAHDYSCHDAYAVNVTYKFYASIKATAADLVEFVLKQRGFWRDLRAINREKAAAMMRILRSYKQILQGKAREVYLLPGEKRKLFCQIKTLIRSIAEKMAGLVRGGGFDSYMIISAGRKLVVKHLGNWTPISELRKSTSDRLSAEITTDAWELRRLLLRYNLLKSGKDSFFIKYTSSVEENYSSLLAIVNKSWRDNKSVRILNEEFNKVGDIPISPDRYLWFGAPVKIDRKAKRRISTDAPMMPWKIAGRWCIAYEITIKPDVKLEELERYLLTKLRKSGDIHKAERQTIEVAIKGVFTRTRKRLTGSAGSVAPACIAGIAILGAAALAALFLGHHPTAAGSLPLAGVMMGAVVPRGIFDRRTLERISLPRVNLDTKLRQSGLSRSQINILLQHSAGVMDIIQFLRDRPKISPPDNPAYALGLSNIETWGRHGGRVHIPVNRIQARGWGMIDFDSAYRSKFGNIVENTAAFLEQITKEGKLIVFFVPRNIWIYLCRNPGITEMGDYQAVSCTTREMGWLLSHPECLKHVYFVFGAYQTVAMRKRILAQMLGLPDSHALARVVSIVVVAGLTALWLLGHHSAPVAKPLFILSSGEAVSLGPWAGLVIGSLFNHRYSHAPRSWRKNPPVSAQWRQSAISDMPMVALENLVRSLENPLLREAAKRELESRMQNPSQARYIINLLLSALQGDLDTNTADLAGELIVQVARFVDDGEIKAVVGVLGKCSSSAAARLKPLIPRMAAFTSAHLRIAIGAIAGGALADSQPRVAAMAEELLVTIYRNCVNRPSLRKVLRHIQTNSSRPGIREGIARVLPQLDAVDRDSPAVVAQAPASKNRRTLPCIAGIAILGAAALLLPSLAQGASGTPAAQNPTERLIIPLLSLVLSLAAISVCIIKFFIIPLSSLGIREAKVGSAHLIGTIHFSVEEKAEFNSALAGCRDKAEVLKLLQRYKSEFAGMGRALKRILEYVRQGKGVVFGDECDPHILAEVLEGMAETIGSLKAAMCSKGIDWVEENFPIFEKIISVDHGIIGILCLGYKELINSGQIELIALDSDKLRAIPSGIPIQDKNVVAVIVLAEKLQCFDRQSIMEESRRRNAHMAERILSYYGDPSKQDTVLVMKCGSAHLGGVRKNLIKLGFDKLSPQAASQAREEYRNIIDNLGATTFFRKFWVHPADDDITWYADGYRMPADLIHVSWIPRQGRFRIEVGGIIYTELYSGISILENEVNGQQMILNKKTLLDTFWDFGQNKLIIIVSKDLHKLFAKLGLASIDQGYEFITQQEAGRRQFVRSGDQLNLSLPIGQPRVSSLLTESPRTLPCIAGIAILGAAALAAAYLILGPHAAAAGAPVKYLAAGMVSGKAGLLWLLAGGTAVGLGALSTPPKARRQQRPRRRQSCVSASITPTICATSRTQIPCIISDIVRSSDCKAHIVMSGTDHVINAENIYELAEWGCDDAGHTFKVTVKGKGATRVVRKLKAALRPRKPRNRRAGFTPHQRKYLHLLTTFRHHALLMQFIKSSRLPWVILVLFGAGALLLPSLAQANPANWLEKISSRISIPRGSIMLGGLIMLVLVAAVIVVVVNIMASFSRLSAGSEDNEFKDSEEANNKAVDDLLDELGNDQITQNDYERITTDLDRCRIPEDMLTDLAQYESEALAVSLYAFNRLKKHRRLTSEEEKVMIDVYIMAHLTLWVNGKRGEASYLGDSYDQLFDLITDKLSSLVNTYQEAVLALDILLVHTDTAIDKDNDAFEVWPKYVKMLLNGEKVNGKTLKELIREKQSPASDASRTLACIAGIAIAAGLLLPALVQGAPLGTETTAKSANSPLPITLSIVFGVLSIAGLIFAGPLGKFLGRRNHWVKLNQGIHSEGEIITKKPQTKPSRPDIRRTNTYPKFFSIAIIGFLASAFLAPILAQGRSISVNPGIDLNGLGIGIIGLLAGGLLMAATHHKRDPPKSGALTGRLACASHILRVGMLTGGGPASGHNWAIYNILKEAAKYRIEVVAIRDGWAGLTKPELRKQAKAITLKDVAPYAHKGGTILGTSRENPYKEDKDGKTKAEELWQGIQELELDALFTLGGDDTNGVSAKLHKDHPEFRIIGLPKTMDNDIALPRGSQTYGFDSFAEASTVAALNGLVDAKATNRFVVVEAFGRKAGFAPLRIGANVRAARTLIPEEEDLDLEQLIKDLAQYHKKHGFGIVVVSEGVKINPKFANNRAILDAAFAKEPMAKLAFERGEKDLDDFGHPKLKDAGLIIAAILKVHLKAHKISISHAGKMDYLFRSADTSPKDMAMCAALGSAAVKRLIAGESGIIIYADQENQVHSLPLTKKLGGRKVDYKGRDKEEFLMANQALGLAYSPQDAVTDCVAERDGGDAGYMQAVGSKNTASLIESKPGEFTPGRELLRILKTNPAAALIAVNIVSISQIPGHLLAAIRQNAAIIMEVARSQLGYALSAKKVASYIRFFARLLNCKVPIILHGDHIQYSEKLFNQMAILKSAYDAAFGKGAFDQKFAKRELLELLEEVPLEVVQSAKDTLFANAVKERAAVTAVIKELIQAGFTSIAIDASTIFDQLLGDIVLGYYSKEGTRPEQLVVSLENAFALPLEFGTAFLKADPERDAARLKKMRQEVSSVMRQFDRSEEEIASHLEYMQAAFGILAREARQHNLDPQEVITAYDQIMYELNAANIAGCIANPLIAKQLTEKQRLLRLPTCNVAESIQQCRQINILLSRYAPKLVGKFSVELEVGHVDRKVPNPRRGGKLEAKMTHSVAVRIMVKALKKVGLDFDLIATNNGSGHGTEFNKKTLIPVSQAGKISPYLTAEHQAEAAKGDAEPAQHGTSGSRMQELAELSRVGVIKFNIATNYQQILLNILYLIHKGLRGKALKDRVEEDKDALISGLHKDTRTAIMEYAASFKENPESAALSEDDSLFLEFLKRTHAWGVKKGKIKDSSTKEDIATLLAKEFKRVLGDMDPKLVEMAGVRVGEDEESSAEAKVTGDTGKIVGVEEIIKRANMLYPLSAKLAQHWFLDEQCGVLHLHNSSPRPWEQKPSEEAEAARIRWAEVRRELDLTDLHGNLLVNLSTGKGLVVFGLRDAGKSTFTHQLLKAFPGVYRLISDDIFSLVMSSAQPIAGLAIPVSWLRFSYKDDQGNRVFIPSDSLNIYQSFVELEAILIIEHAEKGIAIERINPEAGLDKLPVGNKFFKISRIKETLSLLSALPMFSLKISGNRFGGNMQRAVEIFHSVYRANQALGLAYSPQDAVTDCVAERDGGDAGYMQAVGSKNTASLIESKPGEFTPGRELLRILKTNPAAALIAVNIVSISQIPGHLIAAIRQNAAIIMEVARSQLGYALSAKKVASYIRFFARLLNCKVPIILHGDHIQYSEKLFNQMAILKSAYDAAFGKGAFDQKFAKRELLELLEEVPLEVVQSAKDTLFANAVKERAAVTAVIKELIQAGFTSIAIDASTIFDQLLGDIVLGYYSKEGTRPEQLVVSLENAFALPLEFGTAFLKADPERDAARLKKMRQEVSSVMRQFDRSEEEIASHLEYMQAAFGILAREARQHNLDPQEVITAYDQIMYELNAANIAGCIANPLIAKQLTEKQRLLRLPTCNVAESIQQCRQINILLSRYAPKLVGKFSVELEVGHVDRKVPNPRRGGKLEAKMTHSVAVRIMVKALKKVGLDFDLIATNNGSGHGTEFNKKTLIPVSQAGKISPYLTAEHQAEAAKGDAEPAQHGTSGSRMQELAELSRVGVIKFNIATNYQQILLNILYLIHKGLRGKALKDRVEEDKDALISGLHKDTRTAIMEYAASFKENPESAALSEDDSLFLEFLKRTHAWGVKKGKIKDSSTKEDIATLLAKEFKRVFKDMDPKLVEMAGVKVGEEEESSAAYPLEVPEEEHKDLVVPQFGEDRIGLAKFIRGDRSYSIELFEDNRFYTDWYEIIRQRLEKLAKLVRGPPVFHVELTSDPQYLDINQETGLPNVAACDINRKIIFIHPYFFKLSEAKQLEILYHELISHIEKGITDEAEGVRDTEAAVKKAPVKTVIAKVLRAFGWSTGLVVFVASLGAAIAYPSVLMEYLPVLIQGLALVGLIYLVGKISGRFILKTVIMASAIAIGLAWNYLAGNSAIDISAGMLVRFASIFAGIGLARLFFTKEHITNKISSTIKWALPYVLVTGYYYYFALYPFIGSSFSAERFGTWAPLFKAGFDLTVCNLLVITWMQIGLGAVFGEDKDISKGRQLWESFKKIFPYNLLYWLPVLMLIWHFFPDSKTLKFAHAGFVVIWIGIFEEIVRRTFLNSGAEKRVRKEEVFGGIDAEIESGRKYKIDVKVKARLFSSGKPKTLCLSALLVIGPLGLMLPAWLNLLLMGGLAVFAFGMIRISKTGPPLWKRVLAKLKSFRPQKLLPRNLVVSLLLCAVCFAAGASLVIVGVTTSDPAGRLVISRIIYIVLGCIGAGVGIAVPFGLLAIKRLDSRLDSIFASTQADKTLEERIRGDLGELIQRRDALLAESKPENRDKIEGLTRRINTKAGGLGILAEEVDLYNLLKGEFQPWRVNPIQLRILKGWATPKLLAWFKEKAQDFGISEDDLIKGFLESIRKIQWLTIKYICENRQGVYVGLPVTIIAPSYDPVLMGRRAQLLAFTLQMARIYDRGIISSELVSAEAALRNPMSQRMLGLAMARDPTASFLTAGLSAGNAIGGINQQGIVQLDQENFLKFIKSKVDTFIHIIVHETEHFLGRGIYPAREFAEVISKEQQGRFGDESYEDTQHLLGEYGIEEFFSPLADVGVDIKSLAAHTGTEITADRVGSSLVKTPCLAALLLLGPVGFTLPEWARFILLGGLAVFAFAQVRIGKTGPPLWKVLKGKGVTLACLGPIITLLLFSPAEIIEITKNIILGAGPVIIVTALVMVAVPAIAYLLLLYLKFCFASFERALNHLRGTKEALPAPSPLSERLRMASPTAAAMPEIYEEERTVAPQIISGIIKLIYRLFGGRCGTWSTSPWLVGAKLGLHRPPQRPLHLYPSNSKPDAAADSSEEEEATDADYSEYLRRRFPPGGPFRHGPLHIIILAALLLPTLALSLNRLEVSAQNFFVFPVGKTLPVELILSGLFGLFVLGMSRMDNYTGVRSRGEAGRAPSRQMPDAVAMNEAGPYLKRLIAERCRRALRCKDGIATILVMGPPASGKSFLIKRIRDILERSGHHPELIDEGASKIGPLRAQLRFCSLRDIRSLGLFSSNTKAVIIEAVKWEPKDAPDLFLVVEADQRTRDIRLEESSDHSRCSRYLRPNIPGLAKRGIMPDIVIDNSIADFAPGEGPFIRIPGSRTIRASGQRFRLELWRNVHPLFRDTIYKVLIPAGEQIGEIRLLVQREDMRLLIKSVAVFPGYPGREIRREAEKFLSDYFRGWEIVCDRFDLSRPKAPGLFCLSLPVIGIFSSLFSPVAGVILSLLGLSFVFGMIFSGRLEYRRFKHALGYLLPTAAAVFISGTLSLLKRKLSPLNRKTVPILALGVMALAMVIRGLLTGDQSFGRFEFLPFIMLPCDRMGYLDELRMQREREARQNRKKAEKITEEIEKSVEEMGELLDEIAEEIADEIEGDDETETEIDDEEKHDIREVTIKTFMRYLKSDKKSKSYAEAVDMLAKALKDGIKKVANNGPLSQEKIGKIKDILKGEKVGDALKRAYDKAESEIKPIESNGGNSGQDAAGADNWATLQQRLHQLKHRMGGGPHHHKVNIIFLVILSGYLVARLLGLELPEELLLLGLVAQVNPIGGPSAQEGPDYIKLYTNDLDELARRGELDDAYYVSTAAAALNNRMVNEDINNFMVVGDPAVCQGLIEAIVARKGDSSLENLKKARFFEINTARFADTLAIPGQLEVELSKLSNALKAAYERQRVVLVLDFQDFAYIGKMKAGMMGSTYLQLKEAIEAKNISVVILASPQIYETLLVKDKRLDSKFDIIDLRQPADYDLLKIARDFTRRINRVYKNILPDGVRARVERSILPEALTLSQKYYPEGLSVNKLQEVIDKIITRTFTKSERLAAALADTREKLLKAAVELSAKKEAEPEEAEFLELTLDKLLSEQEAVAKELKEHGKFLERIRREKAWKISIDDIAVQISEDSGVPLYEILATEDELLRNYVPGLKRMLIGQDQVVNDTYDAFCRRRAIGERKNQPIGIYLLIGPTGVGKTEFARSLARHMFGSEDAMIRMDMSEYMNPVDDQKLIGPPPGYIGYEQGGNLTNHVLRRPYSVVLLDEIEKAHPRVFDLLLQVFQEGELRDGRGRVANFKNTIIIMTSNLGFSEISEVESAMAEYILETVKVLRQMLTKLDSELKDEDVVKALEGMKSGLQRLKQEASEIDREDKSLDKELGIIDGLLSIEEEQLAAEARLNYVKKYIAQTARCLVQIKELNISNTYKLIARLKGSSSADQQGVDSIVRTDIENMKRAVIGLWQGEEFQGAMDYQNRFIKSYLALTRILGTPDLQARREALLDYLRQGIRDKLLATVKAKFRPELIGRIGLDNIIAFDPLSSDDLDKILDIKLGSLNLLLKEAGYLGLELGPALRKAVLRQGYDVTNGARPLERALKRIVLAPLAEHILSGSLQKQRVIRGNIKGDKVVFSLKEEKKVKEKVTNQELISKVKQASGEDATEEALSRMLVVEEIPQEAPLEGNQIPEENTIKVGETLAEGQAAEEPKTDLKDKSQAKAQEETPEAKLEALRKRLEIDVPEAEAIPDLDIDESKIDEKLQELEKKVKELDRSIRELDKQMRTVGSEQKRQALAEQRARQYSEKVQLERARDVLISRKEGRADEAEQMIKKMTEEKKDEREQLRKEINATFDNLSLRAQEGLLDDLHPPFDTLDRLASIIRQKRRNYPMILSDSILVQQMIVDSFAQRVADGRIEGFKDVRILRLKLEMLKSSFSLVGYFELKMRGIAELIEKDDEKKALNSIIVIDFDDVKSELEQIRVNPFMLGYFLRMFKGLKTVSFIMTTSRQAVVEDDSFDRYFNLLEVSAEKRTQVLENLYLFVRDYIQKKNNGNGQKQDIQITFAAMQVAVKIWEQYFSSQSAVEVLNRWFSGLVVEKGQKQAAQEMELQDFFRDLLTELQDLFESEEISEAGLLDNDFVLKTVRNINEHKAREAIPLQAEITPSEIIKFASEMEARRQTVEIDVDLFRTDERENLLKLEGILGQRIICQEEAIKMISSIVKVGKAGMKPPKAPLCAFIFAGPTGVGKTQLAKTLAEALGMSLQRIDMSAFTSREQLNRLIGAPPGYVGYDEGEGTFIEHMKKHPKSVIIFDEIEKAVPSVMNILLQVLEDGRLTSNRGDTVRFNEAVIILTTNMGMKQVVEAEGKQPQVIDLSDEMGEVMRSQDAERIAAFKDKMAGSVRDAAKLFFRPEFLNRIEATLIFNPLPIDSLGLIVEIVLNQTAQAFLEKRGINLKVGSSDKERKAIYLYLADLGYNPTFGARPMEGAVKKYFENEMARFLTDNPGLKKGDSVVARFKKKICFEIADKGTGEEQGIPEEDRQAISAIAKRYVDRPSEALTVEELEEIFGFRQEVDLGSGERLEFGPLADRVTLENANFLKKDPAAREATASLLSAIPAEVVAQAGVDPAEYSRNLSKLVKDWVKQAVRLAKMANLEAYIYEQARKVIKDYYNLRTGELNQQISAYIEQDSAKTVEITWEYGRDVLKIGVTYNSGLTRQLKKMLFSRKYVNREQIEQEAERSLLGLLKARLELEPLGAEMNFCSEDGKTTIWLSLPAKEYKQPPRPQAAPENTDLAARIADVRSRMAEIQQQLAALKGEP
ncbi:AAA family ATPase, partial [Candidatus Omnitrophota bacterium]